MSLSYEVRDRIAYVTLGRPERHNALRDEDLVQLGDVLRQFDDDAAADIGIVHGRGPSFCSGSDVVHRMQRAYVEGVAESEPSELDGVLQTQHWKPLIAAVQGYCLGQGIGLAFMCDHVVACSGARFQVTEAVVGVPAATFVERLGGGRLAMEAGMTGRFFTAQEAAAAGMLTRLVDDGHHLTGAEALAREILANPQGAIRELVRYRRLKLAQSLFALEETSRPFDWAGDLETQSRIKARIARHQS
ncbi:MAG: enoyl-CoA hydratase/isomerase family protein [Actinomycetota bacterium]|nr:enoyl-CoA hydratase/isomerase family protein [Actinomycetota bacterium]